MDSNTPFFDCLSANDELNGYFNTLPEYVKETIVQSHSDIKTVGELKSIADGLLGKN